MNLKSPWMGFSKAIKEIHAERTWGGPGVLWLSDGPWELASHTLLVNGRRHQRSR